jgi:hypothetical protein
MHIAATGYLSLFVLSAGAAQAAAVDGTYEGEGSGACVVSQAGFNADFTPILATGQSAGTLPFTLRGTTTFDASTGTGVFQGNEAYAINVIVPGSAQTYYFGLAGGRQTIKFKYTTSTNAKGQTILKLTPNADGGEVLRITAGTGTGDVSTASNGTQSKGIVTSSGAIVVDIEEPSVSTVVTQHPDGSSQTVYQVCTYSGNLLP